ncbi:Homeodomain-like protein [Fennellomyces sp. T-0311]|nr:Homeodomain-like protein [Fennellomyces sp. T-0311]
MLSVSSLLNRDPPCLYTKHSQVETTQQDPHQRPAVLDICNLLSPPASPKSEKKKIKRKRATAKQVQVLNQVFEQTLFPSTQLRMQLGKELGMSPRTVQIWFQNRRQAIRMRERRANL